MVWQEKKKKKEKQWCQQQKKGDCQEQLWLKIYEMYLAPLKCHITQIEILFSIAGSASRNSDPTAVHIITTNIHRPV